MNKKLFLLFSLFLILISVKATLAHKVNVFGYREVNCIIGEAYFSDGSSCKKCLVEIYDEQGEKIAQTTTDERGKFKVLVNEKGSVKIKLIAGEGHLAEYEIEDLKEVAEKNQISFQKEISKKVVKSKNSQIQASISKDELKNIVREVVAKETEGIKSMLMDLKKDMNKTKIHEIISGIGYIFGIWGIIALLKTRKRL